MSHCNSLFFVYDVEEIELNLCAIELLVCPAHCFFAGSSGDAVDQVGTLIIYVVFAGVLMSCGCAFKELLWFRRGQNWHFLLVQNLLVLFKLKDVKELDVCV